MHTVIAVDGRLLAIDNPHPVVTSHAYDTGLHCLRGDTKLLRLLYLNDTRSIYTVVLLRGPPTTGLITRYTPSCVRLCVRPSVPSGLFENGR